MKGFTYEYAPEIIADGKPHLAVGTSNGMFIPVVQVGETHGGTPLWFVEDPRHQGKVFPLFVKSLTRREWVLRCACGKPECTMEWVLKVKTRGHHPLPDALATSDNTT